MGGLGTGAAGGHLAGPATSTPHRRPWLGPLASRQNGSHGLGVRWGPSGNQSCPGPLGPPEQGGGCSICLGVREGWSGAAHDEEVKQPLVSASACLSLNSFLRAVPYSFIHSVSQPGGPSVNLPRGRWLRPKCWSLPGNQAQLPPSGLLGPPVHLSVPRLADP